MNREVVVDPGEDLAFAAADQEDPAYQIELPQVHRRFAFPPLVGPFVLLLLRIDQSVSGEGSVDGCAGRGAVAELGAACSPPAVLPAHLTDGRLDRGRDAVRFRMASS